MNFLTNWIDNLVKHRLERLNKISKYKKHEEIHEKISMCDIADILDEEILIKDDGFSCKLGGKTKAAKRILDKINENYNKE